LHAPELPAAGGTLKLPAGSAAHARVLRLLAGARVELFDGRGGAAEATIAAIEREYVVCDAQPRAQALPATPALHLVLGLPKGDKPEEIVRMLSELGVAGLHLAHSERSVPRPRDNAARMARLSRIALEACAQSGQPCAPVVSAPRPLLEVTATAPDRARRLVFWECADIPLHEGFDATEQTEVWAVIGPEGGLSEAEVEALCAQGYARVGLGTALLRVDTAAVVAAALLLDRLGRMR
jgi:16S rRNA (uracil1498-N3)-methyltransferase